jgi:hypothetical protein
VTCDAPKISDIAAKIYARHGDAASAQFESVIHPGLGHVYTAEMWQRMEAWFG